MIPFFIELNQASINKPIKGESNIKSSQSTFVLPVTGKKDQFIYMGDRWMPDNPIDGRYIWLPIQLKDGYFEIEWKDNWNLSSTWKSN